MSFDRDAAAALFGTAVRRRSSPVRRPSVVAVACALMVGWGGLECLAAAGGLLVTLSGARMPPVEGLGVVGWMFQHFVALATVQLICGALTAAAGIGVWMRWPWARRAAQMVMCCWACTFVAFAFAMALSADSFARAGRPIVVSTFLVFWRTAALAAGLMWAGVAMFPAWLLARPQSRRWFAQADEDGVTQ